MAATVVYPIMQVRPDGTTTTMDPDGTIHSMGQTPIATTSAAGKVKPDGTSITVDQDGVISSAGPRWEVRRDSGGRLRLAIVIPEVSNG